MKRRVGAVARGAVRSMRALRPWKPSGKLDVAELGRNLDRIRFREDVSDVPGWLTIGERTALYALGRFQAGPILEVGSFAGKSTACIAFGIRDSHAQKRFVTVDRFPELANFREVGDGMGWFEPSDAAVPFAVLTKTMYEEDFFPVLRLQGGILGALRANLGRRGLTDLVEIVTGDFRDLAPEPFGLVFCDALHSSEEIEWHAPSLAGFVRPGSVVAAHDTNDENEALLRTYIPLGRSFTIDRLLVAEVV